ncbi:MAG: hypothetical protein GY754_27535 [bacterium]|nr:hypothetical protein [bacterium]
MKHGFKKLLLLVLIFSVSYSPSVFAKSKIDKSKKTLYVRKRNISSLEYKGKQYIALDMKVGRKRSRITKYLIPRQEFLEKAGAPDKIIRITLTVKILNVEKETYDPEDPKSSSPSGGFRMTYIICSIVSVPGS